jgi:hypothetical protein
MFKTIWLMLSVCVVGVFVAWPIAIGGDVSDRL